MFTLIAVLFFAFQTPTQLSQSDFNMVMVNMIEGKMRVVESSEITTNRTEELSLLFLADIIHGKKVSFSLEGLPPNSKVAIVPSNCKSRCLVTVNLKTDIKTPLGRTIMAVRSTDGKESKSLPLTFIIR